MKQTLLEQIHRTNDAERALFGAVRVKFNDCLDRWYSDLRPDQVNNNFFVPVGDYAQGDIEAAIACQRARGLDYLMLRQTEPMDGALREKFGFEEEITYVMALRQDAGPRWKQNAAIEIRDIQTSDIGEDLLDVSSVPEQYQAISRRNMELVLKVAREHPEYHWLCAYQDGVRVWTVYALCHEGCVEMDDLWVAPAYRGKYIATTLMKYIAEQFPGTLYLHADAAKTPREMYGKMGFEIVETVYEYYRP